MILRPCWTRQTEARFLGLALAREAGRLLAWDEGRCLYLWDLEGRLQGRHPLLQPIVTAAISDDGSQIVVADKQGEVWWLNGQLQMQFSRPLEQRAVAVALEPLGRYVALSTKDRRTHLFTRSGKTVATIETPRPLHHLVFVPTQPCLLGAADYGYVGCFDGTGQSRWRDALVAHVGSLVVDGQGKSILAACYSHGLQQYNSLGKNLGSLPTPHSCRLASIAFDGSVILCGGEADSLSLLQSDGEVIGELPLQRPASALALGALGDLGAYGHADGEVVLLEIVSKR